MTRNEAQTRQDLIDPALFSRGWDRDDIREEEMARAVDLDPVTREALARVIGGTAGSGLSVYVAINNKAEGSAPLSVIALGQAVARLVQLNR